MKRSLIVASAVGVIAAVTAYAPSAGAVAATAAHPAALQGKTLTSSGYHEPLCSSRTSLCADPYNTPYGSAQSEVRLEHSGSW